MKKIFYAIVLLVTITVIAENNTDQESAQSKYSAISTYMKKFTNFFPTISENNQEKITKILVACGLGSYYGFLVNHHMNAGNSFIKSLIGGFFEGTLRLSVLGALIIIAAIIEEKIESKGGFFIGIDLGGLLFP